MEQESPRPTQFVSCPFIWAWVRECNPQTTFTVKENISEKKARCEERKEGKKIKGEGEENKEVISEGRRKGRREKRGRVDM